MEKYLSYKYQFGFQEDKATCMVLNALIKKIADAPGKIKNAKVVFPEFAHAFDIVNHWMLVFLLDMYGVRETTPIWFKDYPTDIMHYVARDAIKSEKKNIWLWRTARTYPRSTSIPTVHKWPAYGFGILIFKLVCKWYQHAHSLQGYWIYAYVPLIEWVSNQDSGMASCNRLPFNFRRPIICSNVPSCILTTNRLKPVLIP